MHSCQGRLKGLIIPNVQTKTWSSCPYSTDQPLIRTKYTFVTVTSDQWQSLSRAGVRSSVPAQHTNPPASLRQPRAALCSVHGVTAGIELQWSSCLQPCWHWGWFSFRPKGWERLHTCSFQRRADRASLEASFEMGKTPFLPKLRSGTDWSDPWVRACSTVELCPSSPSPCWGHGDSRQLWAGAQVSCIAQRRWG